ncbi:E3 ubiquitin-protein ligase KEG (Protein KEEP ON GOING) (RING finger protein KEG) (RING-type E3 ubiquitin transferase KEG) [Durusdinium trenchii]|uniref:E3 ubiquitin-protein ligase KEG (Protein KEEP ON GOING) (RING finger protein KEG) (RING-type E3 ubiquitin transferase KEG) n=1 Tax=Durusdinium trenchii TaxID=1381693 RepID=A0ABP0KF25_9DINO
MPETKTLDWDEAPSDDEESVDELRKLLRRDTSKSELIKRLIDAGERHARQEKGPQLQKLLLTNTLNQERSLKRVREHEGIKEGMRVRSVSGSVGVVTNIDRDGTFRIDSLKETGQGIDTWHAARREIERDERADSVRPGALVQLREDVATPRFGLGFLSRSEIGIVVDVKEGVVYVNFGHRQRWHGALDEFDMRKPFDCLQVGSHVQLEKPDIKPRYGWGQLKTSSAIGVVSRIDGDDVFVNFPEADDWRCRSDEIHVNAAANMIRPGELVRVHPRVTHPKLEWGTAQHSSSGLVQFISHDGVVSVDFDGCLWHGLLSELEIVEGAAAPLLRKRIAIVVGNRRHDDPIYPELKGATNDSQKMHDKLRAMGFDFVLLVQDILHKDIHTYLCQVQNHVSHGSIVVFYFAGHGEQDHRTLLPMRDSKYKDDSTKVDVDDIFHTIAHWPVRDLFVCFVLDCCRLKPEESSASQTRISAVTTPSHAQLAANQYYWVHSCQKFRVASESNHGDFTSLLLQFLDQHYCVQELFEKVTAQLGPWQRPSILQEGHEASQIVLASANNTYTPAAGGCQQCQDSSRSDSTNTSQASDLEAVERLKASICQGEPGAIVDSLCETKGVLSPDLHAAVEEAAMEFLDVKNLGGVLDADNYTGQLAEEDVRTFKLIFEGVLCEQSETSRGSRSAQGSCVGWMSKLKCAIQADMKAADADWSATMPLVCCIQRVSPKLAGAIKMALASLSKAVKPEAEVVRADPLELHSAPQAWVGQDLLDSLFDEEFSARVAFIMKLMQEGHLNAESQAAEVNAILTDRVLGLGDGFKAVMSELLRNPQTFPQMRDWKLCKKETEVVERVLRLHSCPKSKLLESIPPQQCAMNMLDVIQPMVAICLHDGHQQGWNRQLARKAACFVGDLWVEDTSTIGAPQLGVQG